MLTGSSSLTLSSRFILKKYWKKSGNHSSGYKISKYIRLIIADYILPGIPGTRMAIIEFRVRKERSSSLLQEY